MQYYTYKAIDEMGNYSRGRIAVNNQSELSSSLATSGLRLISCKEKKSINLFTFHKVRQKDLITFFIHLDALQRAGVPLLDSIEDVKENSESSRIRSLARGVAEDIKNGSLFSESLAKYPEVFDKTYINLIAIGEKTGRLQEALNNIIEDIKWSIDMKRKITKLSMAPMFGLFLILSVLMVMTSMVIPKVTAFLTVQSIELPFMTVALIAFSNFCQNYGHFLIGLIVALFFLIKALSNLENFGVFIDGIKLKLPIIGPLILKIESARFCQFFSVTFGSGIGVLQCVESGGSVMKNKAMKKAIREVAIRVSEGKKISDAIASTGIFPKLVSKMFKIGEESGNIDQSLKNIKFFYEREINDSVDKMVALIQPTITILMGGLVAWITLAVFGPIYGSFSKIK